MALKQTNGLCETCIHRPKTGLCKHRKNYEQRGWCRYHQTENDKDTSLRFINMRSDFKK